MDIKFNSEVSRKDIPLIIAKNRHLADIGSVRLPYDEDGYPAGQVLGRNSVNGQYGKYDNGGASGLDTARCVLLEEVPAERFDSDTGSFLTRALFGGFVFKDNLVDLDANAETDLGAKTQIEADGVSIMKF